MNKYEQMKAAAAQGKRRTPLIPGMTRKEKIAAKDKEMETRGRFPVGTTIELVMNTPHTWQLFLMVNMGGGMSWRHGSIGGGVHQLLTEAYEAWAKAGRPGQVVNSPVTSPSANGSSPSPSRPSESP